MIRTLHCYAEGKGRDWEAVCLDLDIAVQGRSFAEVYESLEQAIETYLESVRELPESERARLLNRRAPLSIRLKFLGYAIRAALTGRDDGQQHAEFTLPAAA